MLVRVVYKVVSLRVLLVVIVLQTILAILKCP